MTLDLHTFQAITQGDGSEAWQDIVNHALNRCRQPIKKEGTVNEVTKRDREIGELDHLLSSTSWELWQDFSTSVERTSDRLIRWWNEPFDAKAILLLDGLSLRELPWLIQGAEAQGLTLHSVGATASELPGETTEFAKALGFTSRSQLQNNGGGLAHKLVPTRTECVDLPWLDCAKLVDASKNWVFWHHWPDSKLHDGAGAGQGLDQLTKNVVEQLTSDDFWLFVKRLAQGRRLVITSDHGYAATGLFFDAAEEQSAYLKNTFKSGRSKSLNSLSDAEFASFIPPVSLQVTSPHGPHLLALGRWKWRSQGGYPTLAHGGLSLLEVLSPYVELSL